MKLLSLLTVLTLSTTALADLSPEMTQILEKLDSECAGNDNGLILKYDVKKIKTSDVLKNFIQQNTTENVDQLFQQAKQKRSPI